MPTASGIGRLDQELRAQGIPTDGVADLTGAVDLPPEWHLVPRPDGVTLRIDYLGTATPGQIVQGDDIARTFDLRSYQTRPLYTIYAEIGQELTAAQLTSTWNDLSSGSPKKYLTSTGPNASSIICLDWAVSDSGATGASLNSAKKRIISFYVQDYPSYLVQPPWDVSINIPGGEPVP